MLCLMPLQMSWAAVAVYCQHENEVTTSHFGHHEHEHQAAHVEDGNGESPSFQFHGDCFSCHGVAAAMLPSVTLALYVPSTDADSTHPPPFKSASPYRPERPQWALAV